MLSFNFLDTNVRFGDYVAELHHIGYSEPRKPWYVTPHMHTIYELHCISEGNGVLYTHNEKYDMIAGTTCLTGPEVYHGQSSGIENSMDEYCVRFNIEHKPQSGSDSSETRLIKSITDNPFFVTRCDIEILPVVKEMLSEACSKLPGYKKALEGLFCELLLKLARFCANIEKPDKVIQLEKPGISDVKSTLDTFLFSYHKAQSVEEIIEKMNISRRHFSRLMQKYYGMSYTEKITELRIEYAKQLLSDTDMSVSDIAQTVGYSSKQQFVRSFKRCTGMNPGEFRNSR